MTTLEVVEAVQRSLENEGLLQVFMTFSSIYMSMSDLVQFLLFTQTIRAQLRANVLRIIASGPNYVPQSGKVVVFGKSSSGYFCSTCESNPSITVSFLFSTCQVYLHFSW